MTRASRLLAGTAGTALTLALTAAPLTAAADVTVAPTLPTTLPTEGVPVAVPTVTVPVPPAEQPPLPAADPAPPSAGADSGTTQAGSLPKVSPPPVPTLPAPPTSGGGQSAPPTGSGDEGGGTAGGSPLGDDALPPAVEAELCTLLTTLLGPLPAEVKGLPATVIDELPAQVTDLVPADVLATVTLRCLVAEPTPPADARTEVRSVTTKRSVAKAPQRSAAATRRPARAGLAALPHTGLAVALPVAAGGALLLAGLAVRRAARRGQQS